MRHPFIAIAVIVSVASSVVWAQAKYTGPSDPAADAAAEKAVAKLGSKRGIEIRGTVLTIPALLPR
jgi:hypothetical protein